MTRNPIIQPQRPVAKPSSSEFTDKQQFRIITKDIGDRVPNDVTFNNIDSLNFIQHFQRRSRKCLSQSGSGRPSCFSDRPEKHKL